MRKLIISAVIVAVFWLLSRLTPTLDGNERQNTTPLEPTQDTDNDTDKIPFSETPTQTQQRQRTEDEKSFVQQLDFSKLVIGRDRVNELITSDSIDPTLDNPQMIYERYGKEQTPEPPENTQQIPGDGRRLVVETEQKGLGKSYSVDVIGGQIKRKVSGATENDDELLGQSTVNGRIGIDGGKYDVYEIQDGAEIFDKNLPNFADAYIVDK